ncbi:DEAD/DEAH box helicase, partial [candidate division KSB1 bacterium]|nr:DEAD/DEAH box helicase [candidate division KSB1 bacterium]
YGRHRRVFLRIGTTASDEILKIATPYFDNNFFLKPEAYYFVEGFIEQVKQYDPHFRVYEDALDYIIHIRDKNNRIKSIEDKFPEGIDSAYFKDLVKTKLYPYQKQGVLFAAKAGRVLLADDMGLGKTIQAIAATELLAREFAVSNVLIICPTSLKYQWKSEISKFTDRDITVIEGPLDQRKFQYKTAEFYKIASYGVALNDIELLNAMAPDLVILDEAQRIKNWKTKTAQNVKKIKSDFAIVLTGTPLENRLEELHSIVEFIDKYKLGALFRFVHYHQIVDDNGKVIGYQNLSNINDTLKDVLLRRTKKEIADQLPERVDKNYFVDITREQFDIHEDYANLVARLVSKWNRFGYLSEGDRQRLMIALNCMRMVSDSTYILDQKTRFDKKIDELLTTLKEIFENSEEKVVIFSQWERMTRLVAAELEELGIGFENLHGGVPSLRRKELIDNFKNDPQKRVFLSTDAGGVGLNLQSANVLINLDLPWNPAVLEQRIARVHRLGQKKNVRIINFISKNTIEMKILELISFKRSVFDGVLDGGEDRVLMDKDRFKKFMNSVQDITTEKRSPRGYSDEEAELEHLFDETPAEQVASEKAQTEKEEKQIEVKQHTAARKAQTDVGELVNAGLALVEKIGAAVVDIQSGAVQIENFMEHDEKTGQSSLRIPIKDKETVVRAVQSMAELFSVFAKSIAQKREGEEE